VGIVLNLILKATCESGHLSGFRDEDRKMLTFEPNDDSLISDRSKSNTGIVKQRIQRM
jgi:hypothetical protein